MTIIEGIAERIAAITYDDLPPLAVEWAKMASLDTVGVTLAGAREECAQIVDADSLRSILGAIATPGAEPFSHSSLPRSRGARAKERAHAGRHVATQKRSSRH